MYVIRAMHLDNKMEYWSNDDGWTYYINTATFFTPDEMTSLMPYHGGKDVIVEWVNIPLSYKVLIHLSKQI